MRRRLLRICDALLLVVLASVSSGCAARSIGAVKGRWDLDVRGSAYPFGWLLVLPAEQPEAAYLQWDTGMNCRFEPGVMSGGEIKAKAPDLGVVVRFHNRSHATIVFTHDDGGVRTFEIHKTGTRAERVVCE